MLKSFQSLIERIGVAWLPINQSHRRVPCLIHPLPITASLPGRSLPSSTHEGLRCGESASVAAAMVAEVHRLKYRALLTFLSWSILLNLFLSSPHLFTFAAEAQPVPGWTRRAAREAELVAAIPCSGHGRAFLDGVPVGGAPRCECHTCYGGNDCSELVQNCTARAQSGDASFLETYWVKHASESAVLPSGWHRMDYAADGNNSQTLELERHIRLLHAAVGNAVTEGRHIVFGAGAAQLINAAIHALSPDNATSRARVVAASPYYWLFRTQTIFFDSRRYEWSGVTSNWLNGSASPPTNFIEMVTSPNNPEGLLRTQPDIENSSAIYDHVFYWPHYSAIPSPADNDVMLFSMSKLSGHSGSRFGWAIVKNESIYRRIADYVSTNTIGVSRESQLRMLSIVKVMIAGAKAGGDDDMFVFGRRVLRERWIQLNEVVNASRRFSLQRIPPQYCNYFKEIRDPSPAFGWLKCELEAEEDCAAVLTAGRITSRPGALFEADGRYARVSLISKQDDFDVLLLRLKALVAPEAAANSP